MDETKTDTNNTRRLKVIDNLNLLDFNLYHNFSL